MLNLSCATTTVARRSGLPRMLHERWRDRLPFSLSLRCVSAAQSYHERKAIAQTRATGRVGEDGDQACRERAGAPGEKASQDDGSATRLKASLPLILWPNNIDGVRGTATTVGFPSIVIGEASSV